MPSGIVGTSTLPPTPIISKLAKTTKINMLDNKGVKIAVFTFLADNNLVGQCGATDAPNELDKKIPNIAAIVNVPNGLNKEPASIASPPATAGAVILPNWINISVIPPTCGIINSAAMINPKMITTVLNKSVNATDQTPPRTVTI